MRFFVFVLLFVSFACYSQDPAVKLQEVVGPSPDAASIQKYGDYKVSAYTGVPDITIPIYDLKVKDIDIPISISYHSGGIKVAEEASRVGLGWSLNAGGMITRNVLGLDDFWPESRSPNSFDLFGFPELSLINTFYLPFGSYTYDISQNVDKTVDESFPLLDIDLEPDDFNLSLPGRQEKFVFLKGDSVAHLQEPSTNTKIMALEPNSLTDSVVFKVVTSDGTQYFFNQYEICQNLGGPYTVPRRITAWYLTQIISVRGTTVTFNYTYSVGFVNSLNHPTATKGLYN